MNGSYYKAIYMWLFGLPDCYHVLPYDFSLSTQTTLLGVVVNNQLPTK